MGYYTRFNLDFELLKDKELPNKRLCEHQYDKSFKYCPECGKPNENNKWNLHDLVWAFLEEKGDDFCWGIKSEDDCKWYENEDDMKVLSKQFPYVLFILSGEGESSGDIWKKYFVDGKMQLAEAKITFDEFNPEKLV